jgi:hypothetical protein
MEQFPKFVASRLASRQQPGGVHPDADILTAFAENRLYPAERKPLLAHLATCAECREVMAVASAYGPQEPRAAVTNHAVNWATLRLVAGFAAVCLLIITVVRHPAPTPHSEIAPQRTSVPAVAAPPPAKVDTRSSLKAKKTPALPRVVLPKQPPLIVRLQAETAAAQKALPPPMAAPRSVGTLFGFMPQRQYTRVFARPWERQSLWNVSPIPGVLQKSDDGGQTWSSIVVNSQTNLLALSVSGGDIWAGGKDGSLFHSTDNGLHWNQVTVWDGTVRLGDAITAIETHGPQVVRVRTKSGDWLSSDGGVSWITK